MDDSDYCLLRRIIGACDDYERVYATQLKYGLSHSEEEVAAICLQVETDARIDRQMKEFIDGCGRVLICLSINPSIYLAIHRSIFRRALSRLHTELRSIWRSIYRDASIRSTDHSFVRPFDLSSICPTVRPPVRPSVRPSEMRTFSIRCVSVYPFIYQSMQVHMGN